uniref:monodehydroascorbate reductase (NADH) n=1 Tax=Rhizochromulina marina TaxID=1034831 RepID=A0A7S2SVG3_9STRA|mmetsp:Transcript_9410/g.26589  ORF Transcript_9410/g.26589 Transcript_9410/m.26589 type:complete len:645 (+) Transcript_9410:26-1960(+)
MAERVRAKRVFVGGGSVAGRWAASLASHGAAEGSLILSHHLQGVYPYDEQQLATTLIDPDARLFSSILTIPWVKDSSSSVEEAAKGSGGVVMDATWYQGHGVEFLWQCEVTAWTKEPQEGDQGELHVLQVLADGRQLQVVCDEFVVGPQMDYSHGVRLHEGADAAASAPSPATDLHADVVIDPENSTVSLTDSNRYGFGSIHTLTSFQDAFKFVVAVTRAEEDGQETCLDPVVVVGDGVEAMQVIAMLVKFLPDLPVVLVLPGGSLLPSLIPRAVPSDIRDFYERQLTKNNVKIARGYEVVRPWATTETGSFSTLEGPASGLQPTRPRNFESCQPQFVQSRGLVLQRVQLDNESEMGTGADQQGLVHLPARMALLLPRPSPSTSIFSSLLPTDPATGALEVDDRFRTPVPGVYAVGGAAAFPLVDGTAATDGLSGATNSHWTPLLPTQWDMAEAVGRDMAGTQAPIAPTPIPHADMSFFDLHCRFRGVTSGEPVMVGDTTGRPKFFACVFVRQGRLVGIFLEGGDQSHDEALEVIARERPQILSVKKLRKLPLPQLMTDPFCLVPPELGVGEFVAEVDDEAIQEAFRRFDITGAGCVKTSDLAALMKELGADWDAEEQAEAQEALDPFEKGSVSYASFVDWWKN